MIEYKQTISDLLNYWRENVKKNKGIFNKIMNILDDIKKNFINKPFLNHKRAVLSVPVRHIFMIATIGFLKIKILIT